MDRHRSNQKWGRDLAVSQWWACGRGSSARVARWGRRYSQMTEVGVYIMWSRVIKLGLCRVHQDRHQASETPEGEIEHKGKLEAYQQS